MATPVLLPRQGNTAETCVIVRWLKNVGDTVRAGEPLVEIETDKTTVEVESSAGGTLLERMFPEGADVAVLTPIALVGVPGETLASPVVAPDAPEHHEPAPTKPQGKPELSLPQAEHRAEARFISPRAARLAAASNVDVGSLAGSGPDGRIIERDVLAALDTRGAQGMRENQPKARSNAADTSPNRSAACDFPGPTREVVFTGTRLLIAERMRRSLHQAAQLTLHRAADVSRLMETRARLNQQRESAGLPRVSVNDLVLFAVSRALTEFPALNAHCMEDRVVEFAHVHLGIAVDTPRGLLAPVVRFAERLSLESIGEESGKLAEVCRNGSVRPEQLQGGTFTVSNLGSLGIEAFTPVLNSPEVGILGIGCIHFRPSGEQQQGATRPHLMLSLTFDHRALDGAPAARFLSRLAEMLGDLAPALTATPTTNNL